MHQLLFSRTVGASPTLSQRLLRAGGSLRSRAIPLRQFPHRTFFWNAGENGDGNDKKDDDDSQPDGEKKEKRQPKRTYLGGTKPGIGGSEANNAQDSLGGAGGGEDGPFMPSRMGFGDEAPKYPHLIGLPVVTRPLFPGVLSSVTLSDPTTIEAMEKLSRDGAGYVGIFLRKDSSSGVSENGLVLETPEVITDASALHQVGTFAQIHRIQRGVGFGAGASGLHAHPTKQEWDKLSRNGGNNGSSDENTNEEEDSDESTSPASVLLYTHRRLDLQSVESVGPPIDLTVSHWDRLQYKPQSDSKEDDTIRALTNEVLSTIRDVAQMNPLFREHMQFFPNRIDPSDPYRLADFVATVTTGTPEPAQSSCANIEGT